MDKPIDISKLCLDKLSKIKDTDKYLKLKECKSINPKNIQEKTNNKIIGEKCKAYLQKQAKTTKKITKQDLYNNCEVLREAQGKGKGKGKTKKKGGRGGRGGRGGGGKGTVNKLPEAPKKQVELNNTEKKIKDLEKELAKHALTGNEEGFKKTAEKLKDAYCGETAQIGYNVIAGTFNTLFNSFEKGKLPNVGWDGGKYLLGTDLGTAIKSIAGCLYDSKFKITGVGSILEAVRRYLGIWRGTGNPPRRGNPPDNPDFGGGGGGDDGDDRPPRPPDKKDEEDTDTDRRKAPTSTQLQPQGQAQQQAPTTADILIAQQQQQRTQAYKDLATQQSKALEQEISQSSLRDKELMDRKGLVNTPQGIMTREQAEQFKKGEQALQEENKKQSSSWSDLFTDIAEDIGKGVAVAGGLTLPLASVGNILRNQPQGLTAEQARQANIDFANEPPFPQEGQVRPRQRQPAQQPVQQPVEEPAEEEEFKTPRGKPADSPSMDLGDLAKMSSAGLALGASLLGQGKTQRAGLALGLGSLLRPQLESGSAVSLEEDMISRGVEASMLGGREEEAGKKPPPQEEEGEKRLERYREIIQKLQRAKKEEEEEEEEKSLLEIHRDWEQRVRERMGRGREMTGSLVDRLISETEETREQLDRIGERQAEEVMGDRVRFLDDFMGEDPMGEYGGVMYDSPEEGEEGDLPSIDITETPRTQFLRYIRETEGLSNAELTARQRARDYAREQGQINPDVIDAIERDIQAEKPN